MELTKNNRETIDSMSYEELLSNWRFAPTGDPWLEGETGKYFGERMSELKTRDPEAAVAASKAIGWG